MSLSYSIHAPPLLPFDVVAEILCRVPVKHLLQFRSVCKSWNSLISGDSMFAKKHLRLSTSNHDRHHLILVPTLSPKELVLHHSPISSIFSSAATTTIKQFSCSGVEILIRKSYGNGVSSCDGIVCFMVNDYSAVLCNPSIRKFKMLPPLKFPIQLITLYTLAYDRFINTYKVIAVNWKSSTKIEVRVHTLGTNYWRRIQHPRAHFLLPKLGIFVSDSVNWLARADDSYARFIVSLDLEKESYQKLSLPLFDVQFATRFMTLETLKGCLSLSSQRDKFSDVWIMKEYGNEKSWTKLLSVPHMRECGFYRYTRPLYVLKDDRVLMEFLYSDNLTLSQVVYDSINNTIKIPNFQDNIHMRMTPEVVYVESLISPL